MSFPTPNAIRAAVTELHELLGEQIEMMMEQIKFQTRPSGDLDWIKHCAEKSQLLQHHQAALKELEEDAVDVLFNTLSFESDDVEVAGGGLRTITVEVSQGMLNQHLLTLTDARRQRVVHLGEKFKIQLTDGTEFTTELCDPGNKLRERGLIRRFYDEAKITAGDKVILKETSKGNWRLLSENSAEGAEIVNARRAKNLARLETLNHAFAAAAATVSTTKEPAK
jgi:hypothetical protein